RKEVSSAETTGLGVQDLLLLPLALGRDQASLRERLRVLKRVVRKQGQRTPSTPLRTRPRERLWDRPPTSTETTRPAGCYPLCLSTIRQAWSGAHDDQPRRTHGCCLRRGQ